MSQFTPKFIAFKFIRFVSTLFIVTFFTTVVLNLVPGSPALAIGGPTATPYQIHLINVKYGFNRPVLDQYWLWLVHLSHGDLGSSAFTQQPVLQSIRQRLPVTAELAVLATIVAVVAALILAIQCAQRPGGKLDQAVRILTYAQISVPAFVVALVTSYFFAVKLGWLPLLGFVPLSTSVWGNLDHMILPVFAIALAPAAGLTVVLRADLLQTLQQDFVALAKAKGHSTRTIMWKHALKPSSFSLITLSSLQLAGLLGGTVLVEQIFVLPGIGQLLLTSIAQKDFPVVAGIVTFVAVVFLTVNFLVDIMYGILDPRVRNAAGVAT
jgi:peptide/nickel transport system permease protein